MEIPTIIAGRFRIECEIGKGGMGTVYRATHLGLERPVAVKIIKPEFASDPHVAERFMREARTMAKLRHPHAAMIFDAGNLPDGRHFIVMEFVEGETLSQVLAREGRFTPERAVRIASDICDVLAEAHALGIVHRDLKPSNIMLNERGVCVLDFGVAKVLSVPAEAASTYASTGSGFIVGTPRYMSPEQCLGQKVGARSDLYSLGVLVYEMLAGQPPFTDPLPSAVLIKQATAQPPPLLKFREDVPRPLTLAVHTLLAKQADNRPRTALAARTLLQRSIIKPTRELPEAQPFSSTLASQNAGRSVVFRAVTPLAIIAALGAMFFIWGRNMQSNGQTTAHEGASTAAAARDSSASGSADATANVLSPPLSLSLEEAQRIVRNLSHGATGDVRVVRLPRASAIVVVHDEQRAGTSHLFVLQRDGERYHIAGRAPLDAPDFRGASWTAETVDSDGDGFDEVLYTGTNAKEAGFRLVLYAPRTRQAYALRIAPTAVLGTKKTLRGVWSPSALARRAQPYRAALQQRASAVLNQN